MSLSLENGHVVFQYYLGEGSFGRIQTAFKYNRNKWVSVTLLRNGYYGEFYCLKFQGEYISLSLEKGHVVFQYYLGKGSYGRLQTEFKHNTNKWVSVAIARNRNFGEFLLARAFMKQLLRVQLRKVFSVEL